MFKANGVDWHFSKEDSLLANEHLMITISSYWEHTSAKKNHNEAPHHTHTIAIGNETENRVLVEV